jgi:hypothetical protein
MKECSGFIFQDSTCGKRSHNEHDDGHILQSLADNSDVNELFSG